VDAGEAVYEEDVAPEIGLVQLAPVYHWYEYGPVPPEAALERVIDWPESIAEDDGLMAPAERAPLTVTASPGEHADRGPALLLSVTK